MENIFKKLIKPKENSCECGDINCKRKIVATKNGRLYIENFFTCGKIKNFINNNKDKKF